MNQAQIHILTCVYDDGYLATRRDEPVVCTSAGKRILLHKAIREATGCELTLLSPHPRGRSSPYPLPEQESTFGKTRQLFSKTSSRRKIRFLTDIVAYAKHVYRHTRDGDILIIDNYEIIYLIAVWSCRLRGRRNPIVLEYEDGKHLIDKGIWKLLSGLAESMGRPLVRAAILATPKLVERLPEDIPSVVIPGILNDNIHFNPLPQPGEPIHFLYSGSLDYERGGPLLLDYLESGNFPRNAVFHITGQGHFKERLESLVRQHPGIVHFHGCVSVEELDDIRSHCHFGLNLQSSSNPISEVTYPSKTFDYLNAGLRVISTRTAEIEIVLGEVAIYLDDETPADLAAAINKASETTTEEDCAIGKDSRVALYTPDRTTERLSCLFKPLSHR
jgi:hypothetical protein